MLFETTKSSVLPKPVTVESFATKSTENYKPTSSDYKSKGLPVVTAWKCAKAEKIGF